MTPGAYLEKRRLMAGYSLSSLARELLMLTGFGTTRAESDFRRLRVTLISAEQDTLPHSAERIDLIRAFVPLDPAVYFRLLDGEEVPGLCGLCGCSFFDPCVLPAEPAALLGATACLAGEAVCSECEQQGLRLTPASPAAVGGVSAGTVAEQLRALGERMARLANSEDARAAVRGLDQLSTNLGQPPFLRLVPNHGEPS